ncbi:hypothetical protein CIB84_010069, partial [Bambusicola thoracicus]
MEFKIPPHFQAAPSSPSATLPSRFPPASTFPTDFPPAPKPAGSSSRVRPHEANISIPTSLPNEAHSELPSPARELSPTVPETPERVSPHASITGLPPARRGMEEASRSALHPAMLFCFDSFAASLFLFAEGGSDAERRRPRFAPCTFFSAAAAAAARASIFPAGLSGVSGRRASLPTSAPRVPRPRGSAPGAGCGARPPAPFPPGSRSARAASGRGDDGFAQPVAYFHRNDRSRRNPTPNLRTSRGARRGFPRAEPLRDSRHPERETRPRADRPFHPPGPRRQKTPRGLFGPGRQQVRRAPRLPAATGETEARRRPPAAKLSALPPRRAGPDCGTHRRQPPRR